MSSPDLLHYHHDRADLRGVAWLLGLGGAVVLAIGLALVGQRVAAPYDQLIAAIAIVIWLAALGVAIWRVRAASGRADTLALDASGFSSKLFGRVNYAQITRCKIARDTKLWRWEYGAPALILKLTDKRRLRFHLDARHYESDLLDYVAFVDTVSAAAGSHEPAPAVFGSARWFGESVAATPASRHPGAAPAPAAQREPSAGSSAARERTPPDRVTRPRPATAARAEASPNADEGDGSVASRLSQANRQAGQRFREQMKRNSKWAALGMVLLSLSYTIRACDMGWVKSTFAPGPFDNMAERAPAALDKSASMLQQAIADKGPVYLWSNVAGDAAKPVLAPNVDMQNVGIDTLDMMNTAGRISRFIVDGEAEGYRMGVQHDDTLTLSDYSKISLRPVAGEHRLFFFLLPPEGVDVEKLTGRKMPDITWRVRYRDVADIPEQMAQASTRLPMSLVTRWLQMTPPPRLMVAGAHYYGMTEADFEAAVDVIKQDFERHDIDTTAFATRRFANGTTRKTPVNDQATADRTSANAASAVQEPSR
ncbi:hypothetical protein S4A8_14924 [Salinisphaera sp. S4-8]|uniref:hypothetical protein n=1 Tax=Salinisphaera sp. S4-8 TaxID=633357 RepID=UPI0033410BCB